MIQQLRWINFSDDHGQLLKSSVKRAFRVQKAAMLRPMSLYRLVGQVHQAHKLLEIRAQRTAHKNEEIVWEALCSGERRRSTQLKVSIPDRHPVLLEIEPQKLMHVNKGSEIRKRAPVLRGQ